MFTRSRISSRKELEKRMGYLFEASLSYKRIRAAIQNEEINNTHYSQAALTWCIYRRIYECIYILDA